MIQEVLPVGLLACNCYILGDESSGEALVIDPGDEIERVQEILTRHRLRPKTIIATPGPTTARAGAETGPAGIHKGMLDTGVDTLLGRPFEVRRGMKGSLNVSRCTYEQGENAAEAQSVEGVLARYAITSK